MKNIVKKIIPYVFLFLLITGFTYIIFKAYDNTRKNAIENTIELDEVLNNLSNTTKIVIKDTWAKENNVYIIEKKEEIDKITSILANMKPTTEDTNDTSRYRIVLFDKDNEEYVNLSFYPIKIKGYNEKLTLGESTTDLSAILGDNYSAKFPEINENAEKILKSSVKIEVRNFSNNELIKIIENPNTIEKIANLLMDTKVDDSGVINTIALKYSLSFWDKKEDKVADIKYDPYLLLVVDNKSYKLVKFDQAALTKLIEN